MEFSSATSDPAQIRFTERWGFAVLLIYCCNPIYIVTLPCMADAQVRGAGSPLGDVGTDGSRRIERRRGGGPGDSPVDILMRLPAVVVLERIPVPSLAMARDGVLLFANSAFAEMVGYGQDTLVGLAFPEIFHTEPAVVGALSSVDALANLVVELRHAEGWMVRARMSKSALVRSDDPVVLVTFENLTERLWADDRACGW
jgi:PAS domain S-box-containing protein